MHNDLTTSTDSEKATMLAKVFFPPLPLVGPESEVEEPDFFLEDASTARPPRDRVSDSDGAHQSDQETSGGSCTRD